MNTFSIDCSDCGRHIEGEHCVFLPTLSTYVECECGTENIVPFVPEWQQRMKKRLAGVSYV